jgi:hypothetical protein
VILPSTDVLSYFSAPHIVSVSPSFSSMEVANDSRAWRQNPKTPSAWKPAGEIGRTRNVAETEKFLTCHLECAISGSVDLGSSLVPFEHYWDLPAPSEPADSLSGPQQGIHLVSVQLLAGT